MSKIGAQTITVNQGVTVEIKDKVVHVKGPKGELSLSLPATIDVVNDNGVLTVSRTREDKKTKSLHGLYRSLVANAVLGVQNMWEKKLEIVGTGFNAKMQGQDLALKTGYSHPVIFTARPGVTYSVEGTNIITVSSVNKQAAGEVAHLIKLVRKPDPYKGKGIKYVGEQMKLKPGKKAKAAGAA